MEKYFGIQPFGATPTYRQVMHYEIGKKAFFHFGVNTFSDLEWGDGTEIESMFNPSDLDIKSWIRSIKAAGFKLAIITAKHHDGFCLWPSKYTEHSVKNSPYKNGKGDIIREFCDACREYNMKIGIYVSPWDRNCPLWGTEEYTQYYANQLEEIVTQYGKIDEIWWDGAGSVEAKYDWGLWAYIIRKHQPDCVIFGTRGATPYAEMRWVGNEAGFAGKTHYASLDRQMLLDEVVSEINVGKVGGELYVPAEVDVSIRPGWFYHKSQDNDVKTSREIDNIWFRSVGRNAIMLLNFPPDTRGLLVDKDVENAIASNRRIEKMLSVNLLDSAKITADSTYCSGTEIDKALFDDNSLFYATNGSKNEAVIDILLDGKNEINTAFIGEKIELGERITSFRLECLDTDEPVLLFSGTSVGYLKAMQFECGKYRHLRLTLSGVAAPLTLRHLSAHYYEEGYDEDSIEKDKTNIAALDTTKITFSSDRKEAIINFGGIYTFDTISFVKEFGGGYAIYAFDGAKFYLIKQETNKNFKITVKLDEPISSSYQIKIVADQGIMAEPDFIVI